MLLRKRSLIVLLSVFSLQVFAQSDSVQKPRWYQPRAIHAEYAGGFGMISAGPVFSPVKRTEITFTLGYTPPAYGNIWTGNLLISYKLFPIRLNKKFTLNPIVPGIFANFNFGKNIYLFWPEYYPAHYYWWNSSIRCGPFINSELTYSLPEKKSVTFFFQVLTNDLYLFTYLPNTRFISFDDILVFGTGIKYHFR